MIPFLSFLSFYKIDGMFALHCINYCIDWYDDMCYDFDFVFGFHCLDFLFLSCCCIALSFVFFALFFYR